MTCKQLGGACDAVFRANSFEKMADMSKQHGKDMFQKQDVAHLQAMSEMHELMKTPAGMEKWFESKRQEFETLPDSKQADVILAPMRV